MTPEAKFMGLGRQVISFFKLYNYGIQSYKFEQSIIHGYSKLNFKNIFY